MYYQDLTPYDYGGWGKNVLNIGWLENGYDFPVGNFPEKEELLEKLNSTEITHKCRGFHCCDFCTRPQPRGSQGMYESDNHGNGEYRVGKYSAPVLITHYIETHGYKPPQEFIDAVIVE